MTSMLEWLRPRLPLYTAITATIGQGFLDSRHLVAVWGRTIVALDNKILTIGKLIAACKKIDTGTKLATKIIKIDKNLSAFKTKTLKSIMMRKWTWKEENLYAYTPTRLDSLAIKQIDTEIDVHLETEAGMRVITETEMCLIDEPASASKLLTPDIRLTAKEAEISEVFKATENLMK